MVAPADPALASLVGARRRGFTEVADARGVRSEFFSWTTDRGDALERDLGEAMRAFPRERVGVFGYNDLSAMKSMTVAHKLGLAVPGQVAVIGVDNLEPARVLPVPLSTITYDPRAFGSLVLRRTAHWRPNSNAQTPTPEYRVIARESTLL